MLRLFPRQKLAVATCVTTWRERSSTVCRINTLDLVVSVWAVAQFGWRGGGPEFQIRQPDHVGRVLRCSHKLPLVRASHLDLLDGRVDVDGHGSNPRDRPRTRMPSTAPAQTGHRAVGHVRR
jgi:hypothetical protein